MMLSTICGLITIIAVGALIIIAPFMQMPVIVRIILILISMTTGAAGITAAAMLDIRAGYYERPHCKALFVPSMNILKAITPLQSAD